MLINATQPEELRVALIDGQSIYDFDIEQSGQERKRSNIYKARVSRVEQSLGAAFVDFGAEKHGFLPVKELAPQYLKNKQGKNSINDCLTQGQEIIVQVDKEERGTKGAALTTFISLPGHYLVLMPNNPEAGGISRSLEGKAREEVKENYRSLDAPENMGLIARTAAEGASVNELQWDLEYLLSVWDAIQEANQLRKAPFLIYRDDDLISRTLRDFLREDITEVLVDSDEAYEKASEFAGRLTPELQDRVKRYSEAIPLFTRYQVESQIETAYQREVKLSNGGSITIDQTEALVAIDINSAKATGGSDIEETALKTNLEAAKEIAKQLRLRDIGGLIVIDFIDMTTLKNKRAVEDLMLNSISIDRAKIQIGRISRFGLLEMSRQRLRPSLQERWTQDIGSLSTAVLRLIEEEAGKKKSGEVRAVVSSDMSVFLLNERRSRINEIEERTNVRVVVVSDPGRSDNLFEVTRLRSDNKKTKEEPSYEIQDEVESSSKSDSIVKSKSLEKAAVSLSPKRKPKRKGQSFFSKIVDTLTGQPEKKVEQKSKPKPKPRPKGTSYKGRKPNKNFKGQEGKRKTQKKAPINKDEKQNKKPATNKNKPATNKDNDKKKDIKNSKPQKKAEPSVKKDKVAKEKLNKTVTKAKEKEVAIEKDVASKEPIKPQSPSLDKEKQETQKAAKDWGRASNDPRNKN
jgi:ribonuclease E